ncbi:MAG: hypothetical protein RIQ60_1000 [Pseudomonadota bacterium]|jgi:PAS domain S-box-containing protein
MDTPHDSTTDDDRSGPWHSLDRRRALRDYLAVVLLVGLTFVLRSWLAQEFNGRPLLILFMVPILLGCLFGGAGPGLLATGLVALGSAVVFIPSVQSLHLAQGFDVLQWAMLLANGLLACVLRLALQRSRQRELLRWREAALAQDALRSSQARFEATFEQAAVGIALLGLDGQWIRVNRRLCDILGYTDAELRRLSVADISHPEDLEVDVEQMRRLVSGEDSAPFQMEKRNIRKDGSVVWIDLTVTLVRTAAGAPDYFVSAVADISARRQAESALRESEAHYRAVVSVLIEGVLVCDPQGSLLSCNAAAEQLVGITQQDWQGRSVYAPGWTLLRGDGSIMPLEETPPGRVLAGDPAPAPQVLQCLSPDGAQVWFDVHARPVQRADGGGLLAVVITFADVTLRKRQDDELARHREQLAAQVLVRTAELEAANHSLAEQQHLLRTVADCMPAVVGYIDAGLVCRFANAAYLPWFGRQPAQAVGLHMRELLGERLYALNEPFMLRALAGETQRFQRPLPMADGTLRHAIVNFEPDRVGSAVRGFVVVITDVSELKQAELSLATLNGELARRVDQAEAATRAKSAFLANMSHEIRTPMNAIIGLTYLLARDSRDHQQRQRLDKVDRAAHHLLQVINDILDLSKIEAGKMVLDNDEFALAELLGRSVEMVSAQARAKGLDLQLDLPPGLPRRVCGDAQRLTQALVNLLGNAVKFTEQGWVRLQVSAQPCTDERLLLRFEVSDSGVGIEPDKIDRLFKAFEQVDNTSTRRHGGTGLGLALTRHLAVMLGGDAGASSTLGVGSRFWFTAALLLPAPAEHAAGGAALGRAGGPVAAPAGVDAQRLRQEHAGRRILLAEDNPINLEVALELLVSVGLTVECAADGRQAVEMALGRPYDLVFMDMQMPVLDGLQATRQIRQRLGPALPVVAMTANAFGDDRQACLDAGMNDHVPKPVNPELLYACVLRWLPARPARQGLGSAAQPPQDLPPLAPLPTPTPAPPLSPAPAAPPGAVVDAAVATVAPASAVVPADLHGDHGQTLTDRLAAVEGFNFAQALYNVGGRVPMLERALARFVSNYRDGAPELLLAPDASMLLRWRAAAHALRGACGTVGASRLHKELLDFECLLDAGGDQAELAHLARALHEGLLQLVIQIDLALSGTPAIAAAGTEPVSGAVPRPAPTNRHTAPPTNHEA